MRIKAMQRVLSLGENQKNSSSVDEWTLKYQPTNPL
jgi:hypothetical protein